MVDNINIYEEIEFLSTYTKENDVNKILKTCNKCKFYF